MPITSDRSPCAYRTGRHRSLLPLLTLAVVVATALTHVAQTAETPQTTVPHQREAFHVYLLMGQSNMVGRDTRLEPDLQPNPRVLVLTGDMRWEVARDPLHPPAGRIPPGVGPGLSFARAMLEAQPQVTIGLVPCAVGGSPLERWVKGGDLYARALERATIAAQHGVLCGILWHQGETDAARADTARTYEARLSAMLQDLRDDLKAPVLPVVVGQLGEFLIPEKQPHAEMVNEALRRTASLVPKVAYVSSSGLLDKGDRLHFSTEAERELGERYARAMRSLHEEPVNADRPTPQTEIALWPAGRMPGRGAEEPEVALPPRGDNVQRITHVSVPTLAVYPAPANDRLARAMIICPRGGYGYVVTDKEGLEIAAWLNSAGITALVLKYRVPGNREGALQDLQRAIRLARAHASDWNLDPDMVGVIGFSAGGNLSARASTEFEQNTYAAIDEADQLNCRPDYAVLVYPSDLTELSKEVSNTLRHPAVPPTLIVHSEDDQKYVEGSKRYSAALSEAKVQHKLILYSTGGHGYGLRCTREARAWPGEALEWIRRLKPERGHVLGPRGVQHRQDP